MNTDLALWYAARIAALAAFCVLGGALLTGMALRTAFLERWARNRAVLALHTFLTWFWLPLVAVHLAALLLDSAARVGLLDLVIPFRLPYGTLAVGLGTLGFLLLILLTAAGALRRHLRRGVWQWLHRLAYPAFALFLLHAQLGGTDFSRTFISVVGWGIAGCLATLALVRAAGGRVQAPDVA